MFEGDELSRTAGEEALCEGDIPTECAPPRLLLLLWRGWRVSRPALVAAGQEREYEEQQKLLKEARAKKKREPKKKAAPQKVILCPPAVLQRGGLTPGGMAGPSRDRKGALQGAYAAEADVCAAFFQQSDARSSVNGLS